MSGIIPIYQRLTDYYRLRILNQEFQPGQPIDSIGKSCLLLVDNTMSGSYFRYVIQSYDLGIKRAIDYLLVRTRRNLLFLRNEMW